MSNNLYVVGRVQTLFEGKVIEVNVFNDGSATLPNGQVSYVDESVLVALTIQYHREKNQTMDSMMDDPIQPSKKTVSTPQTPPPVTEASIPMPEPAPDTHKATKSLKDFLKQSISESGEKDISVPQPAEQPQNTTPPTQQPAPKPIDYPLPTSEPPAIEREETPILEKPEAQRTRQIPNTNSASPSEPALPNEPKAVENILPKEEKTNTPEIQSNIPAGKVIPPTETIVPETHRTEPEQQQKDAESQNIGKTPANESTPQQSHSQETNTKRDSASSQKNTVLPKTPVMPAPQQTHTPEPAAAVHFDPGYVFGVCIALLIMFFISLFALANWNTIEGLVTGGYAVVITSENVTAGSPLGDDVLSYRTITVKEYQDQCKDDNDPILYAQKEKLQNDIAAVDLPAGSIVTENSVQPQE